MGIRRYVLAYPKGITRMDYLAWRVLDKHEDYVKEICKQIGLPLIEEFVYLIKLKTAPLLRKDPTFQKLALEALEKAGEKLRDSIYHEIEWCVSDVCDWYVENILREILSNDRWRKLLEQYRDVAPPPKVPAVPRIDLEGERIILYLDTDGIRREIYNSVIRYIKSRKLPKEIEENAEKLAAIIATKLVNPANVVSSILARLNKPPEEGESVAEELTRTILKQAAEILASMPEVTELVKKHLHNVAPHVIERVKRDPAYFMMYVLMKRGLELYTGTIYDIERSIRMMLSDYLRKVLTKPTFSKIIDKVANIVGVPRDQLINCIAECFWIGPSVIEWKEWILHDPFIVKLVDEALNIFFERYGEEAKKKLKERWGAVEVESMIKQTIREVFEKHARELEEYVERKLEDLLQNEELVESLLETLNVYEDLNIKVNKRTLHRIINVAKKYLEKQRKKRVTEQVSTAVPRPESEALAEARSADPRLLSIAKKIRVISPRLEQVFWSAVSKRRPSELTEAEKKVLILAKLLINPQSIGTDTAFESRRSVSNIVTWLLEKGVRGDIPGVDTPEMKEFLQQLRKLLKRRKYAEIEKLILETSVAA